MNIRQLEVFWAIMRTRSATSAAQMLGVSQPAISKVLRHTEDQLKMKLFSRRSGRLIPTEEAEHLFMIAEVVFDNVEKLRQAAHDFRDSASGRIQIVSTPNLATAFLPHPISRFLESRPRVDLSLKVLTTSQVVSRVSMHQADLGVVFGPVRDTSIVAQNLCELQFSCAIPTGHPLAKKKIIDPQDLASERVISFHRTTLSGAAVRELMETVDGTVSLECDHSIIAYVLVSRGAGVAVMPPPAGLNIALPNVVVRPLAADIKITPQVIFRKTPPLTRLSAALLKEMADFGASSEIEAPNYTSQ